MFFVLILNEERSENERRRWKKARGKRGEEGRQVFVSFSVED